MNNIPPKHCSYACVYCQVQCVTRLEHVRQDFRPPLEVIHAVRHRVAECRRAHQPVDAISFVPDGEPTLDAALGDEILGLRETGVPVAVVTNGSLLWRSDVRRELAAADIVSVKVDAVEEGAWRAVNRPAPSLRLDWVLAGVRDFARDYRGVLLTETMLVAGANDDSAHIAALANFIAALEPRTAYLSLPTRPPFEPDVRAPAEDVVVRSFAIFRSYLAAVELLGVEVPGAYGRTGSGIAELLNILRIHPMLERSVRAYLGDAGVAWNELEALVTAGVVRRVEHRGEQFYTLMLQR